MYSRPVWGIIPSLKSIVGGLWEKDRRAPDKETLTRTKSLSEEIKLVFFCYFRTALCWLRAFSYKHASRFSMMHQGDRRQDGVNFIIHPLPHFVFNRAGLFWSDDLSLINDCSTEGTLVKDLKGISNKLFIWRTGRCYLYTENMRIASVLFPPTLLLTSALPAIINSKYIQGMVLYEPYTVHPHMNIVGNNWWKTW